VLDFWMQETSSKREVSAQKFVISNKLLVLKVAFILALKCEVFCISNFDIISYF